MQGEEVEDKRPPRVVVVGAGFAALGAAGRLIKGGIKDVTLLEASPYPGGRVHTIHVDGSIIQTGAQFLHGQSQVYDFALSEGLLADEEENSSSEDDDENFKDLLKIYATYTFRSADGSAIDKSTVKHNLEILEEFQLRLVEAAHKDPTVGHLIDHNTSVGDFLRTVSAELLPRMVGSKQEKDAMIEWMDNWTGIDCAATMKKLSMAGMGRYVYEQGDGLQETKLGMWDLFQRLLDSTVPQNCVLVNKAVKNICWTQEESLSAAGAIGLTVNNNMIQRSLNGKPDNESEGVVSSISMSADPVGPGFLSSEQASDPECMCSKHIETVGSNSGDPTSDKQLLLSKNSGPASHERKSPPKWPVSVCCEDGEVFFADHVIVTSSIGFLQEHPDFFVPALPKKHQEAIRSMGFGSVGKIFMMWDEGERKRIENLFLPCEDGMSFLWSDSVHPQLKSAKSSLRTSTGQQWYESICIVETCPNKHPCLLFWISVEGNNIMESLPVSEVSDVLHELLMVFLGNPDIPRPSHLIRSEWHSNPYIRGSYSYLPTGVPVEVQDVLNVPVPSPQDPVVQLAGEACSMQYYSTVHGAMYSGQTAASAILRHYNMIK